MKTKKHLDRKTAIEQTIRQAVKFNDCPVDCEAAKAWQRLCRELESMTDPEARMPRFKRLLDAIWNAATNEQQ